MPEAVLPCEHNGIAYRTAVALLRARCRKPLHRDALEFFSCGDAFLYQTFSPLSHCLVSLFCGLFQKGGCWFLGEDHITKGRAYHEEFRYYAASAVGIGICRVVWRVLRFVRFCERAHEALGENSAELRREGEGTDAHGEKARDCFDRRVRVEGCEHHVACERSVDGGLCGFEVADFSDKNDVRIMSENG